MLVITWFVSCLGNAAAVQAKTKRKSATAAASARNRAVAPTSNSTVTKKTVATGGGMNMTYCDKASIKIRWQICLCCGWRWKQGSPLFGWRGSLCYKFRYCPVVISNRCTCNCKLVMINQRKNLLELLLNVSWRSTGNFLGWIWGHCGWLGDVVVSESDSWLRVRGCDSRPLHYWVTTLGKLFKPMCLCSPSSINWYLARAFVSKVKGLTFIYCQTAAVYNSKWRTDWQWHMWRSASSGRPLPEWTDFGPRSLQLDRPTYAPASRTMAFTPQCSPATTYYF